MFKSESIKAGIKKSFESGTPKIADKICYGYSKAPDGSLIINELLLSLIKNGFLRFFIIKNLMLILLEWKEIYLVSLSWMVGMI